MQDRWLHLYQSELQSLWLLLIAPAVFLAALPALRRLRPHALDPGAAGFVTAWAVVFALETLVDPWATGPLAGALGLSGTALHTIVIFVFVLLGDFRIYLLLFHLASRERKLSRSLREAALWTLLVPAAAGAVHGARLLLTGSAPMQSLWIVYESLFVGMALLLRERVLPARCGPDRPELLRYLRWLAGYVVVYYALWAAADGLILSGVDFGWALRIVPNQLYYSLCVPLAWLAFFGSRLRRDMASK